MLRPGGTFAAALTFLVVLGSASVIGPHPAHAEDPKLPTCSLDGTRMSVSSGAWTTTVKREGERIVAGYAKGDIDCGATQPTVTNVDRLVVDDGSIIDLRGGRLSPGASPEADGFPEIEIAVAVDRRTSGRLRLVLGKDRDTVIAGVIGKSELGLNLNPTATDNDPDLVLTPPPGQRLGTANVEVDLGGGEDVYDGSGGLSFTRGTASDLIRIKGQGGNDQISGGDGNDVISGGSGSDDIYGDRGEDLIGTADGARDVIDCGPGRDLLSLDDRDRAHACETLHMPGADPGND